MIVTRVTLTHLVELGAPIDLPGVEWHAYSFPLEGDVDAQAEAEAIFRRSRKAEWVVLTDSAVKHWVFNRGDAWRLSGKEP